MSVPAFLRFGLMRRLKALDRIEAALGSLAPGAPDLETLLDRIDPEGRAETAETDANPA